MDANKPPAKAGPLRRWLDRKLGASSADRPAVPIKELHERDRRRVLRHFIELENGDRLLRFGSILSDERVAHYVAGLDFSRDMIYGVYNGVFRLVGVGHLAFAPKETSPVKEATTKDRVAELGISVLRSTRGRGVGSQLFARAAIHCRNNDIDTLYMHCLSSNQTMMHIAKKAGMEIHRDYGEADAYLKLPPPNPRSVLREAVQEQYAMLDYTFKANARAAVKWLDRLPRRKQK